MRNAKKKVNDFERSTMAYFKDISKYESLSREEELRLWKDFKYNNNLESKHKLINSNLKFVASVAKSYQGYGLSYADLIAEGNSGLIKALDKFDGNKGNKLISYSVWWIRQSIIEAIKKRSGSEGEYLPSVVYKDNDDVMKDGVVDSDLSVFSSLSSNDVEEHMTKEDMKNALKFLLKNLTRREQIVIINHFGVFGGRKYTLEEIGDRLNLTKERVRQIKENALKKLRSDALNNYITEDIYNY